MNHGPIRYSKSANYRNDQSRRGETVVPNTESWWQRQDFLSQWFRFWFRKAASNFETPLGGAHRKTRWPLLLISYSNAAISQCMEIPSTNYSIQFPPTYRIIISEPWNSFEHASPRALLHLSLYVAIKKLCGLQYMSFDLAATLQEAVMCTNFIPFMIDHSWPDASRSAVTTAFVIFRTVVYKCGDVFQVTERPCVRCRHKSVGWALLNHGQASSRTRLVWLRETNQTCLLTTLWFCALCT